MATSTAVNSTAFNFLSFVQPGVDARTGLYTVRMSLPEVQTCDLSGPALQLSLNFNPLNTVDAGYGKGWELSSTQYVPTTRIISTYAGETFKVTDPYPGVTGRLRMKEQKIESFQLYEHPGNRFKVVHKEGLVEILELKGASPQVAVPVKIYSAQGHEVTLEYITVNGHPMLSAIRDTSGVVLQVSRDTSAHTVKISMNFTNGAPAAQVILNLKNDRVDRITLPVTEGAGWRFEYRTEKSYDCISKVLTPSGAVETIEYNDDGHGFPGAGNAQRKLPRVTRHTTDPGGGQPPIKVEYKYSADGHNFLGYGSSANYEDDGFDTLFKVLEPYVYSTVESLVTGTETVRSITREFNRFHLQTQEITAQGNCRRINRTRYYADDNDKLAFEAQPRQCQLPRETSTFWMLDDDPRFWRYDREISEFDIHGNQTLRVEPSGVTERIFYYPSEGIDGLCPKDPYGFVRHVSEKTFSPACDPALIPDLESGARATRTRFRYEELPPLSNSAIVVPSVCLVQEQLFELAGIPPDSKSVASQPLEQRLSSTVFSYFKDAADPLRHGRRARQAVTMGDSGGPTSFIDYTYTKIAATRSLRTEQRSSTNFDNVQLIIIDDRSMLNGEPTLVTNNDIQTAYQYDALNRVLRETQAPGTAHEASRHFTYRLIRPADAGQTPVATLPYEQMEDVKGVRTRTHYDGMSRTVRVELQDIDHSGGTYRDIYTAKYNAKGLLTEETEIDWLNAIDMPLTTRYTYDSWGMRDSVTRPDGVKQHILNKPHQFTTEEWIEGTARTRTLTNRFEKTVSVEKLDENGRRMGQQSFKYDGLSNCTQKTDELGLITRYRYDAFARLCSTTLPDLTTINNSYAPHSRAELCTSIDVTPGNTQLPAFNLGKQTFDGLNRLTQITIGNRSEQLQYQAGHLQPRRRITPSGKSIEYQYLRGLTANPRVITAPDDTSTFDIDLLDATLKGSENSQGAYRFTYDQADHLKVETWQDSADSKSYTTRYSHSLKGRLLSRTDIGNHNTTRQYDRVNGRLLSIEQLQLRASFEYDEVGRVFRTTSTDKGSGNTLTTTVEFDVLGRETRRTLMLLNGQGQPIEAERSIEMTYLADSNVHTRHFRAAGVTTLLETHSYDLRGRLERYRCSGPELPRDRFGNAMTSQYFEYDTIDNIIYSRTVFNDGRVDIAHFSFADDDPCQLVGVRHSHPDYQGLKTDFSYDADGNQQHDELGRQLNYDSQGRLLSVKTAAGQSLTAYRYDPHNHLQSVQPEGETQTLRFYQGTRVSDTLKDDRHVQVLYHQGQPLGQQTPADKNETLLLLTDGKSSVLAENQGSDVRSTVYTPYGERSDDTQLRSLLAFNGEVAEQTGWYLLGNGYRAYNPSLMRFHSPDFMSPFGPGGLNWYMYCKGNPIAFTDPTGHQRQRQGRIIDNMAFNYAVSGTLLAVNAAIFLVGLFSSILTLNPAPLVAALSHMGVTVTAQAIVTVVNLVNLATFAGSIGVEVGRLFVRDEKWNEAMGWFAMALDSIILPNVAIPTPPTPRSSVSSAASKVSSASRDSTASKVSSTSIVSPTVRARAAPWSGSPARGRSNSVDSLGSIDLDLFRLAEHILPEGRFNIPRPRVQTTIEAPNFSSQIVESSTTAVSEVSQPAPPLNALELRLKADEKAQQENIVKGGQDWWKYRNAWTKPKPLD
ncbi:TPA: RHS repeat-associated core domain-containing protein [Pseudomonas putida]|nr:RHS repeat-associated core domain-containing protein [Pseudomonas putida]